MTRIKFRRGTRRWKKQINNGKNTENFVVSSPHSKPIKRL